MVIKIKKIYRYYMTTSLNLFPVINSVSNTINELENGVAKYESLRMQFLISDVKGYNEREIVRTIILFLKSDLCSDKVVDYTTGFNFVNNNGDTDFNKIKRIYKLQDEFINKCIVQMQLNINDVLEIEEDIIRKNELKRKISKLNELVEFYIVHTRVLNIIEMIKYLI